MSRMHGEHAKAYQERRSLMECEVARAALESEVIRRYGPAIKLRIHPSEDREVAIVRALEILLTPVEWPTACRCSWRPYPHIVSDDGARIAHARARWGRI